MRNHDGRERSERASPCERMQWMSESERGMSENEYCFGYLLSGKRD